jgi:hypothetical protein
MSTCTFNEFDAVVNTREENDRISQLFSPQNSGAKITVVFIKGFSVDINWTFNVKEEDIKQDQRKYLIPNTISNSLCIDDLLMRFNKPSSSEILIIWDGDNYGSTCYTYSIRKLVERLIDNGDTYRLIAFRGDNFGEFKSSWENCNSTRNFEINLITGPVIEGNHYEDLAEFSRNKTASFLNSSDINSISIYCFGGGPIMEAELSSRLPFKNTNIMIYNITRLRGKSPDMFFQRNYIFPDPNYSEDFKIVLGKYFSINRGERPICKIENGNIIGQIIGQYFKLGGRKSNVKIISNNTTTDSVKIDTSSSSIDDDYQYSTVPVVRPSPVREAPVRQAPVRQAPVRQAPVRPSPVRPSPVRQAPARTRPRRTYKKSGRKSGRKAKSKGKSKRKSKRKR